MTVRIAMWSGPRNISTALMRSFEARGDTVVVDEPLYVHYLAATGTPHPGAEEIIAAGDPDWRTVVSELLGPLPDGKPVAYQKHMAHHLLPGMGRAWIAQLSNAFLIREPRAMLVSLAKVLDRPGIDDTGLPQQLRLFRELNEATGETPPVVDSGDVLRNPQAVLEPLCERLGISFTVAMLSWRAGRRATDGPWAPYWYANVERSTGFGPPRSESPTVPSCLEDTARACEEIYAELASHRITPSSGS